MLVDGAIMDNVPLAPMKQVKRGPNVVVSFGPTEPRRYCVDYDSIPGSTELAAHMMNPFGRRRLPELPSLLQVIAQSMLAHRPFELPLEESDLLLSPPMPADLSFMDWSRHSEVVSAAYSHARERIARGVREGDARVIGLLEGSRSRTSDPQPAPAGAAASSVNL
jgi:NTE family protein